MTALRVCTIFVGSVRGRIARGWKMSMLIFQRWDSVDFGPVESRAWSKRRPYLWVLQAMYLPHTGLKTGRRLFQSLYGVCTDPHCIRRGTFRNPWATHTGSCYTGQKLSRTQRTGRTHVTVASQKAAFERTSHGPQTPLVPKSYEPGHTRGSHASDLSIIKKLCLGHMKLSDSLRAP